MNYFLDELLEHVFDFLTSHQDRNVVSLMCKSWFKVEKSEEDFDHQFVQSEENRRCWGVLEDYCVENGG